MRHFLKIAHTPVAARIMAVLDANPDLWDEHNRRKVAPGTPHSRMSDIWVRYNDAAPHDASGDWTGFNDRHVPVWYPAYELLKPVLRPTLDHLMEQVSGDMIGGVLITRIPPGEGIAPHADRGWHVDYYDKFYLSLQSAPGATFYARGPGEVEPEGLCPEPGDIWRFDNRLEHWVENKSDQDRVTCIICIRTDTFQKHPAQ